MKTKAILTLSLLLNLIFIGVILAGVYKFNFGNDTFLDGTEINETVIYGQPAEIVISDPNAPDPDAEAIAAAETEDSVQPVEEESDPVLDETLPEEPGTTPTVSTIEEPDNSPVEPQ